MIGIDLHRRAAGLEDREQRDQRVDATRERHRDPPVRPESAGEQVSGEPARPRRELTEGQGRRSVARCGRVRITLHLGLQEVRQGETGGDGQGFARGTRE